MKIESRGFIRDMCARPNLRPVYFRGEFKGDVVNGLHRTTVKIEVGAGSVELPLVALTEEQCNALLRAATERRVVTVTLEVDDE